MFVAICHINLVSVDKWNDSVFDNLAVFVPVRTVFIPASFTVPFLSINQQHNQTQKP